MTERLYYYDSTLLEFEAKIIEVGMIDGRHMTVLDQSAFYPTSGGQLFDRGMLNGRDIIDVVERDDGTIMHMSDSEIGSKGEAVRGKVDHARRKLQMQKHTAQHIFSAVAHQESKLTTMSVHLGEEYVAVEFDTTDLSQEQLSHFESTCNRIIGESHQIEILSLEREEAEKLPLRKPIQREGVNRIIRIGDIDYQACGGTHCLSTADVRILKIVGSEKMHGRLSIQFLAGDQAFADYKQRFKLTSELTQQLTCHMNELSTRVASINDENKQLRQEVARLQKEFLPVQVLQLVSKKEKCKGISLVCASVDNLDNKLSSKLAGMVADHIEGACLLIVADKMIIGTSNCSGQKAGELAKLICADSSLRGGGSKSLAQIGGLIEGKSEHYFDLMRNAIGE